MSARSSTALAGNGTARIAADSRAGLLSARNVLATMYFRSDRSVEAKALLRQFDAAATAHIIMFKTLRSVGDQLRAGVHPRQVAHEIEGVLRSITLPAPGPALDEDLAEAAGEGEV